MKKCALLFFFLVIFINAFSQEGFRSGYIITYKGDTIKGKIKDRKFYNSVLSWQKILFINDKGEKEKLSADEIKGYVKADSLAFHTLTLGIEEKKRFVAIVESGAVILFADISKPAPSKVQLSPSTSGLGLYVTVRMDGVTQKIEGEYYLQKRGDVNSLMQWRNTDYKKTANYFFKGDTTLLQSIENEKLKYEEIQTIVREYNSWKIRQ